MVWYLTGFAWLLQFYFWGIGLTVFVLPRRWWRFWPVFGPYVGIALQSVLVWGVARLTDLRGTDHYAAASLLLPAGLLLAGVRRVGGWRPAGRLLRSGGLAPWGLWLAMAVSFSLVVYPFTRAPGALTSIAMGSCDAADYAAGARVFKEFASGDRSGFLGLTEVVQVLSVTNFYDFWLRLNHFTPSALIALNASLLGCQPHELASLLGVVLLALNLPAVWWLARAGFGLRGWGATLVAFLYGLNPILLYAVYQTALGQLLAAPAVALLLWLGLRAWRGPGTWRRYRRWSGLLLVIHWLIFGSYNFIILFCYAPLAAYVGIRMWVGRRWREGLRWAAWVGLGLLACLVLFPGRIISIEERMRLFGETSFGWRIPPLDYAGWFGLVANEKLAPAVGGGGRALAWGAFALLAWTVVELWRGGGREGRRALGLAGACVAPAAVGYGFLLWQAAVADDNSSYNAYKLFSVFYPATLASLCLFLRPTRARSRRVSAWLRPALGAGLVVGLIGANYARNAAFAGSIRKSGLIVDEALCALGHIEQLPNVSSVNVLLEGYWPRLWANYFLLRKPQYFTQRTYEGRRVTPPRGSWDLRDQFLTVHPLEPTDSVGLSRAYYLLDRRSSGYTDMALFRGWSAPEHSKEDYWVWAGANPQVSVVNPRTYPTWALMTFSARSLRPRTVRVDTGTGGPPWEGKISPHVTTYERIPVRLPPGRSQIRLETPEPGDSPGPGDDRRLTIALYTLRFDLLGGPPLAPGAVPTAARTDAATPRPD